MAIAATRSAALLLAVGKPGLTVVPAGEERRHLAPMPLACLDRAFRRQDGGQLFGVLHRWGLRTLGDLARLPPAALSARMGQAGLAWQRLARGEDLRAAGRRPAGAARRGAARSRLADRGAGAAVLRAGAAVRALAERLTRRDQAATVLQATFRLASRDTESRTLQLPAPMRDPKVLRTLVLLHLESHPLGAGVDRVTIRVETAQAPVTQFSLLGRALPFPEQVAPMLARLAALVGERRVGAPALVDSHRPGAFAMTAFHAGQGFSPARTARPTPHAAEGPPAYGAGTAAGGSAIRRLPSGESRAPRSRCGASACRSPRA